MTEQSLQERLAPDGICFGCGPANPKGLHIRSFPDPDAPTTTLVCEWQPSEEHQAFPGVMNGGIIGALLDCHSNWTALWHLMERDQREETPCTVTRDFHVELKSPTPVDGPVRLVARVVESSGDQVTVAAEMEAGGKVTATCTGRFVAVGPGHPAYHRWGEHARSNDPSDPEAR